MRIVTAGPVCWTVAAELTSRRGGGSLTARIFGRRAPQYQPSQEAPHSAAIRVRCSIGMAGECGAEAALWISGTNGKSARRAFDRNSVCEQANASAANAASPNQSARSRRGAALAIARAQRLEVCSDCMPIAGLHCHFPNVNAPPGLRFPAKPSGKGRVTSAHKRKSPERWLRTFSEGCGRPDEGPQCGVASPAT